ncbi:MAG: hypothetical protein K2O97_03220 [Acetatifactor sp.]|nr:hypothetical protein [Acetatifactor sp.]
MYSYRYVVFWGIHREEEIVQREHGHLTIAAHADDLTWNPYAFGCSVAVNGTYEEAYLEMHATTLAVRDILNVRMYTL